jgi:plastocyanin
MKTRPNVSLLAVWILCVSATLGQSNGPANGPSSDATQTVTGEVTLHAAKSGAAVKDSSRVVEWLAPRGAIQPDKPTAARPVYKMVQHDKMFEPSLLVVPIGSLVAFPNLDPWFHNVFSLYRGKRFDLGLYEAGSQKEVRFDRPGASYVFCNIHPEMAAVVLTVDSSFSGISDKAGHVTIANVPSGQYLLHVWYENSSPEALQTLDRQVTISGSNHSLPAIAVPVTKQDSLKHKNKYGQDYEPDPTTPVY